MPVFNSVDRIVTQAMRETGLLQKGEGPDATDYADYIPRLADIVNLWMTQGLKLWLNSIVPVALVAGQASYTIGPLGNVIVSPKPMRVLEAYYVTTAGVETPLQLLSWSDYNLLPNKTTAGMVNSWFLDKGLTNQTLYLWQVPTAAIVSAGRVDLLVQKSITSFTTSADVLGFPPEWYMALHWALAADISNGQPTTVVSRAEKNAEKYRGLLEDWDVEDAPTRFTVNTVEAGFNRGGFS